MAGNWNPNAPGVVGLELPGAYIRNDRNLLLGGARRVMRVPSTTAEPIDALIFGRGPRKAGSQAMFALLEVYDESDFVRESVNKLEQVPNAHGTGTGIGNWTNQAGSTTNIHLSIDDAVVYPPVGTDYIRTRGAISNAFFHLNSGAFIETRRVGKLKIRSVSGTSGGFRDVYYRIFHVPSSTTFIPPGDKIRTHYYGTLNEIDLGEINPVTLRPWTPVDIQGFGSADNIWQVRITGAGSSANELRVHSLSLEVQYVSVENRVAIGVYQRPSQANDFNSASHVTTQDLFRPGVSATLGEWVTGWLKTAGTHHYYVLRRAEDLLVSGITAKAADVSWHYLSGANREGAQPHPDPGFRSSLVSFWASSDMPGLPKFVGDFTDVAIATIAPQITGAPLGLETSNDSQPYILESEGIASLGHGYTLDINDEDIVGQSFAAPASRTYIGVRAVVQPPVDDPDSVLRILVRQGAGAPGYDVSNSDTQVGGSLDVTASDLLATPTIIGMPGFREIRGFLSFGAPLVSGSQYHVDLEKISGAVGSVWRIVDWEADVRSEASFQGVTPGFRFTIDKSSGIDTWGGEEDISVQLYEQPAAPTGVGTTVVSDPQVFTYDNCIVSGAGCDVPFIDGVQITWSLPATGYGPSFGHWEIERLDYTATTWTPIARGSSQEVRSYIDYDAYRDRPSQYRVRAVRVDDAFSAWVEAPASALRVTAPGGSAFAASTPDKASFVVTDLDVRVQLAMDDWTPGGFGVFVGGQWENTATQNGWVFGITAAGNLQLNYTTDGTTVQTVTSTSVPSIINGEPKWIRVTFDVNNGSGGRTATFYVSDDGIGWAPVGNPVTVAGTITLANVTVPLKIGQLLPPVGDVMKFDWRDGINSETQVAFADFTREDVGTTSFTDEVGNVWTISTAGSIVAYGWARSHDAEVIFASSMRPELNVAYTYDPEVPVDFLDHENDELMTIQGAPFRVAFLDPYDRGMQLRYRIAPVFGHKPVDDDAFQLPVEDVFKPLIDIARSRGGEQIPYVCVLDYEGGRRFAYIRLDDGSRHMPLHRYFVTVTVIPLTMDPVVVEF